MIKENPIAVTIGDDLENWMSLLPGALQNIPIIYLAIPGSHDSASYSITPSAGLSPDAIPFVRQLAKVFGPLVKRFVFNWSVTQQITIKEQLQCGIRYLDLRLGTKTGNRNLFFVHGQYGMEIENILQEIDAFLSDHEGTLLYWLIVMNLVLENIFFGAFTMKSCRIEHMYFAETCLSI